MLREKKLYAQVLVVAPFFSQKLFSGKCSSQTTKKAHMFNEMERQKGNEMTQEQEQEHELESSNRKLT